MKMWMEEALGAIMLFGMAYIAAVIILSL